MKPFILIGAFDPSCLDTWCRAATAERLEVVASRDGDELLRQLQSREAPALVVTGLSLPRADGFELIRALRRKYGPDEVPAVAVSVFARLERTARALQESLGIADVPPAHLDLEQAAAVIRRALARVPPPHFTEDPSRRSTREQRKEGTRLRRIERLGVDQDLPRDSTLQRLVEDAAKSFNCPMALLSVVLHDRTCFLAHDGLGRLLAAEPGAALDWPFCRLVAETGEELVVPDACTHPAFSGNRHVRDGHIRGYAGAPVMAPGGETLGTLAVASTDRLPLSAADVDRLGSMARRVAGELEIRAATKCAEEEADQFGSALGAQDGPATLMATLALARTALEGLDSGLVVMDAQRRVTYVNAAACEILDAPAARLVGMTREELVSQGCALVENVDDFLRRIRVTASGPYVGRADFTFVRPERRDVRWVSRPVMLPSGLGQLAFLTDITAENRVAELQRRFAFADPLTGLANRRAGMEALTREIGRATRSEEPLCLALFDIDGLRIVNRDRGEDTGDRLVRRTGTTLLRIARDGDTVIRWSGEEFLVLLPACRAEEGLAIAERASQGLESPELEELPGIALSAGVVEWRRDESAESAIYRVEEQLRKSKSPRGGQVA